MATHDEIELIGELIYDEIGFTPTSQSTKPTHIANGLLRLCSEQYADISGLYEWIALSKSAKTASVPSSVLLEKYRTMFEQPEALREQQLSDYRVLLEAIFNVDGATFASGSGSNKNDSVLNPVSWLLINNRVRAENDIEKFLYRILKAPIDGHESPIVGALVNAVKDDTDDLSHIIKPICLEYQRILDAEHPGDAEGSSLKRVVHDIPEIKHLDQTELIIRTGFDRLFHNLQSTGQLQDKLSALERIVCFASFAVIFYLLSLNCHAYGSSKIPILLDSYSGLPAISRASEQCFGIGKRSIEEYFINSIAKHLTEGIPGLAPTEQALSEWLSGIRIRETRKRKIDRIRSDLLTYFRGYLQQGEQPTRAAAMAIQGMLFSSLYSATSPSDFCQSLGAKAGLVGPNANRAKKRYVATQTLLETLALSLLTGDELNSYGLEVRDFEDRLWNNYGILIGFEPTQCFGYLRAAHITQNVPGDLRGELSLNANAILSTYTSMGLAKQYADGVSMLRLEV